MPSVSDPEIQELLKALARGAINLGPECGIRQCMDVAPLLKQKCEESSTYRKRFGAWWCKEKQKRLAKLYIEPLDEPLLAPANPPVRVRRAKGAKSPVRDKDRPVPKKSPKRPVQNHHIPDPAPSPEPTPKSDEEANESFLSQFEHIDWNPKTTEVECLFTNPIDFLLGKDLPETPPAAAAKKSQPVGTRVTKPTARPASVASPATKSSPVAKPVASPATKPSPVATPVASPAAKPSPVASTARKPSPVAKAKPVASPLTKSSPAKPTKANPTTIMAAITPEELALNFMAEQPDLATEVDLDSPNCGIEWYKVVWPDPCQNLMITYFVRGATRAEIDAGGRSITVTFPRSEFVSILIAQMRQMFADKLTNPQTRESFNCMVKFFNKMLETKAFRNTVSVSSCGL